MYRIIVYYTDSCIIKGIKITNKNTVMAIAYETDTKNSAVIYEGYNNPKNIYFRLAKQLTMRQKNKQLIIR